MAYQHQIKDDERPRARALWEQVFPEDTPAFLDAFCALKGDNVILGITDADRLVAMIQLDPCRLAFGRCGTANDRHAAESEAAADGKSPIHTVRADYIVGVSTLPAYRHRGLMRTLLEEAVREGAARHDPFLFLMPANEPVYLPFDFRTVYLQANLFAPDADALLRSGHVAGPEDCAALVEAALRVLAAEYDTYLLRDERYFRDLITEMGAEDGKVLRLNVPGCAEGSALPDSAEGCDGYLCYWPNEDGSALIRELVLPAAEAARFCEKLQLKDIREPDLPEAQGPADDSAEHGAIEKHGAAEESGSTEGPGEHGAPKIMVRVLDPAEFVKPLTCPVTRRFTFTYHDAILKTYDGPWLLTVGPEGGSLSRPDTGTAADGGHALSEGNAAYDDRSARTDLSASPLPLDIPGPAALAEWVLGGRAPAGAEDIVRPDRILIHEWI